MTFLYSLTNLKARIIMAYSLNSNYLWRIEFMNERKLHYLLLVAFSLSNKMIIEQTNREKLMPGQPKILEFLLGHDGCTQRPVYWINLPSQA